MKNITHVDLSYQQLTSVPSSFSYLSNLQRLDVSNNFNLHHIPYSLCDSHAIDGSKNRNFMLNIKNTKAEIKLDWSGQLLEYYYNRNNNNNSSSSSSSSSVLFSPHSGCINAFSDMLQSLSLANNQLKCTQNYVLRQWIHKEEWKMFTNENSSSAVKDVCDFSNINKFRKLSYLDLRNNSLTDIRNSIILPTAHIILRNNSIAKNQAWNGISLEMNSVSNVVFNSLEYNLTQNWFNIVEAINRYDEMTRTTTSAAAATKSKLQHIEMRIANIDDTKLKKLNLKKRFGNIKFFDVEGNLLSDLNTINNYLPSSIEWLNLRANKITSITNHSFPSLTNLIYLSLSIQTEPGIQRIVPGAFRSL